MSRICANNIADYIIWYANEAGELITNLKLQKLLYYAQGWYLAHFKMELFEDEFEAWVHGPVVPSIYRKFRNGWQPINSDIEKPELDSELEHWMKGFLDEYLGIDAFELERMTHNEQPWIEARGGIPEDAQSSSRIDTDSMKNYFESLQPSI